ncbi:hypothetical protein GGX14DRAFT_535060 [Mycena pura]|uniref:Arrestin C-terminal-like domain-containing protein n=1 Tax=Mycena pura TaxID=153505 RepID=A0AAD6VHA4_9AGAR|nr:hypothetical protein GGX14DRAFT_535060 [Mycena pura]
MPKNTLTISLNEAAVFLRTNENNARRSNHANPLQPDPRPSMLRGLLTLTVGIPIKVTSIDLELQAKTSSSWPDGLGGRRVEVQEEHKIFSDSIVFFRAGPAPRRTASVGPGVHPWHDDDYIPEPSTPDTPHHDDIQSSRPARPTSSRRVSADFSYFRNHSAYEHEHVLSIPPYTPLPSPPSSSSHTSPAQSSGHLVRGDEDPAHALEDFRNALRTSLMPLSRSEAGDHSPGAVRSSGSSLRDVDRSLSRRPSIETLAEVDEDPGRSSPNRADARGRRPRFNLSSVSSVLKEVVRSSSPRTHFSKDQDDSVRRGRTYTFPISFAIPSNAPPTMECLFGTVVWRLKAIVHRPGALVSRMTAMSQVVVIAAPMEDDTEDTESVVVERQWEQQLQYVISISGRSFPVGGVIPMSITMMPLAKVKIHRLSVYLEEKTEYYSQMKRVVRTDPVMRVQLLSIKHDDKMGGPILPLDSNDVDALTTTPLLALTVPGDNLSELASYWMGLGPWTFHQELQLPPSCRILHFTNKNKRSNICVTHLLKCVIRLERGDDVAVDPKTGKRKLFDIVVQTQVHILSCWCNPEWMSLPRYSASFEDPSGVARSCPCKAQPGGLERTVTHHSTDSTSSVAEVNAAPVTMPSPRSEDTLFARNTLFERLVSGQESELGEAPPAYAPSVAH